MRYLDSGSRDASDTLYSWLAEVLPQATFFGVQTGYFSYDGIFPLEAAFLDVLERSGTMRLVVGANEAGLRRVDLEDVLDLFDNGPLTATTSLTLVAADDVLMHPKTYYVEKTDGTRHALVGSVNLTHPGLSRNIESALTIDSVNDPSAPFAEIRASIEKWCSARQRNAYQVTRESLAVLITDGVLDQQPRVRPPLAPRTRQRRSRVFPGLGPILKLPRKRRTLASTTPAYVTGGIPTVPLGTLGTLPGGAVGIIKRLTKLDTKGFNGGTGTLYMALPNVLTDYLPMSPYGKNNVPRVDITVEARFDTIPGEVVLSGESHTNITHEGVGTSGTSHGDLRFNYLTRIKRGVERLAADHGVRTPDEGDLAAVEFLDGVLVRVTFIADQESIANLTPLLDQRGATWGWLPPGVIAAWDGEDDA